MKKIHIIIIVVLSLMTSSCGSCSHESKKSENSSEQNTYDNGIYPSHPSDRQSQEQVSSTTSGILPNSTMSGEEDAYEEGRALGEEDRHNRTRQHEGDFDDDDYDDDFDEGYNEDE